MPEVVTEKPLSIDPSLLKHPVKPMPLEHLAEVKEGENLELVQIVRDYFSNFCDYVITEGNYGDDDRHVCPACGAEFTGLLASLGIGAGIEWGLIHEEGNCSKCHWPYRGHHFIYDPKDRDEDGRPKKGAEPLLTIRNLFLAYLPDFVSGTWKPAKKETQND